MTRQKLTFTVSIAYVWAALLMFGAVLMHTFLLYPNIFRDVPASLGEALEFMSVSAPSDVFPPFGLAIALTGLATTVLTWRIPAARYWILTSMGTLMVGEALFSWIFFWPRNAILFLEGTAVHPPAYLQQVAMEFQAGHWFRLAMLAATAALSFVGFLRIYRYVLLSKDTDRHGAQV